ncbi:hypothetical protein MUK42_02992 [Musa troglodytarum]|uniref:Uncharacterized protein n=1 Tax=Musa troglodytarum TaxID=320322 RepID=A0A9E7I214_9LILI|nr:hypothetical protein MUK42_02992 [Musa troglodytarum]
MVRLKVLSLTRTHEAGKILLAESRAFYAASAADRTFGNAGTARALIAASFFRHCTIVGLGINSVVVRLNSWPYPSWLLVAFLLACWNQECF